MDINDSIGRFPTVSDFAAEKRLDGYGRLQTGPNQGYVALSRIYRRHNERYCVICVLEHDRFGGSSVNVISFTVRVCRYLLQQNTTDPVLGFKE